MLKIDAKTFNPEVLYVFDSPTLGPASGKSHVHDFFELSIILNGETYYMIEGKPYHLKEHSILLLNPGIHHYEYTKEGMANNQLHIGLRNFHFENFPQNIFPLDSHTLEMEQNNDLFFSVCEEIIHERRQAEPGYDLLLKAMVLKLVIYILRDRAATFSHENSLLLSEVEENKQKLVADAIFYIENHYMDDITLSGLALDLYTSPASLTRAFKDQLNDTPINYLIRYRMSKAKKLIESNQKLSIKKVSKLIGYEDPFYFSKLFKKYYGLSPSLFAKKK